MHEVIDKDYKNSVTQEFNKQLKKLVEDGDVERIDENKSKAEHEKKTKRWFGEKKKL